MNILVTGATGFIGSNLTEELVSQGHIVHILSRDSSKASMFDQKNKIFYAGDITNKESLVKAMTGCVQVFHLAAYAKVWSKEKKHYYLQNVEGTRHVIEAALEMGIKKVLIVSTAGVLGPSGDQPVNESTLRTKPFFTEYEKTKSLADQISKDYLNKGLSIVTVYPTRVFGPGPLNESNSATKLIHQYSIGKWRIIPGNGGKIGNYVYIDNLVSGMIRVMEYGQTGEGYVLGGSNISYFEFFGIISEIIKKKYRMIRMPMVLALVTSSIFLLFAKITGIPPLLTPGWVKKYLHNWSVSSEKAITDLDYDPGKFSEGVENTLMWLKSINKVQ